MGPRSRESLRLVVARKMGLVRSDHARCASTPSGLWRALVRVSRACQKAVPLL
jgi:hypothetical protein